jgi:16S rRNA (cytidine1402-2'-O)-methyltransferase
VSSTSGRLLVVATPIGNMEDITLRALRVLGEVHTIFAEDTRRTGVLLQHHRIERPAGGMHSCHEHNEQTRIGLALGLLQQGHDIALVSDAGTPAISDPGFRLVRAVREAALPVVPIPGASAVTAALSASGLPTDRFTFAGFPPKKAGARKKFLEELTDAPGTLVLYVAARDVPGVLTDLQAVRLGSEIAVFREITKRFEECLRGSAEEVLAAWDESVGKGEVTLLAGPVVATEWTDEALNALLDGGQTPAEIARDCGVSKRRVYQLKINRPK